MASTSGDDLAATTGHGESLARKTVQSALKSERRELHTYSLVVARNQGYSW
jgi:hypothetical protein